MLDRTNQEKTAAGGSIRELDFDQPVVNIGGDPGNDITLTGDGIRPFHAMLMLRDGQYQIVSLAPEADILMDGNLLSESTASLSEYQRLEIGPYSLYVRHNGTPTSMHITLASDGNAPVPVEIAAEDGSEHILLNVTPQTSDVAVNMAAAYTLDVTNAGPIVASFHIAVQGVPEDWVQISPRLINLNEGQRKSVRILITPPRTPTSTAGKHLISLVVTSPNYPRQRSVAQAELDILPYYDFLLGNLSPREQCISWRRKKGMAALPITNQGNSDANFDILALDDENGCSFDFKLNENLELHRQAAVNVPAGETVTLPIFITPLKRLLVALRSKQYHYTASVQVTEQAAAPQVLSGSVTSTPLFGWWSVVLAMLLLASGLFLLLQPRINYFQVAAGKDIIELGDSTTLEWAVSPFATRLGISGIDKTINGTQSHLTVSPAASTTYELTASNWLSSLTGLDRKQSQTVLVVPPAPAIGVFDVDTTTVNKGLPVNLRWSVVKADKAYLTIDEVVYDLPPDQFSGTRSVVLEKDSIVSLRADSPSGSDLRSYYVNVVPPYIDINKFTVWARPPATAANTSGANVALIPTLAVSQVQKPDAGLPWLVSLFTPRLSRPAPNAAVLAEGDQASDFSQKFVELVPDPTADSGYRVDFQQPSRQLSKGEQVMLEWDVNGVQNVNIAPFTETLPKKGKQPFFPQESMNFTLTAKSGELEKLFMLPVTVFDGQPPVAPSIQIFQAAPTKSVGKASVTFSWVISGAWTRIQLTNAGTIVADWLPATGSKKVTVTESSSFILTAWNGPLSSAKPIDITIDPTLKTSTLTITDVYPHAGYFRVGNSVNVYVDFSNLDTAVAAPSGSIVVTDDFSTCTIALPTKFCTLSFTTPGQKKIHAQYSGDSVYLPVDSPVYTTQSIIVEANQVSLSPSYFKLTLDANNTLSKGDSINIDTTSLKVGQGLYVDVAVVPVNAALNINDKKGTVTVRYCRLDANNAIIQTDCITSGTATVTVTEDPKTMSNIGNASLLIQNFRRAGKFGLVFSYAHLDSSFEPVLMSNYPNGNPIVVTVDPGDLILVPYGISGASCTYKICTVFKANPADILFDAKLMINEDPINPANSQMVDLYSTYPQPGNLTITATTKTGTPKKLDWTSLCVWKKSDSGVNYQFLCQGVDFSSPVDLGYALPAEETNYEIIDRHIPINVNVRTRTKIVYNTGLFSNVSVGQRVDLQAGNAYLQEISGTNIENAVLYFNTDNATGTGPALNDILVLLNPVAGKCEWDSGGKGLKLTQSATPSADTCAVYFKKAGSYNLSLTYLGDSVYDGMVIPLPGTLIFKQTGIQATWNPAAPTWDIFTTNNLTLDLDCPSTTPSCQNFAPDALTGISLLLAQNPAASCSVSQSGVALSNGVITLPGPSDPGPIPHPDLSFFCTTKGTINLTLSFYSPDNTNFEITPGIGHGDTAALTINALPASMEVAVSLYDPSTSIYTTVGQTAAPVIPLSALYVQEKYQVVVKIPDVPVEAIPASSDKITMVWPESLINYLDTSASATTCARKIGTTDSFSIPITQKSSSSAGVWWEASCEFTFKTIGTIPLSSAMGFTLASARLQATDTSLNLPNAVSKKFVMMNTQVNTGGTTGAIAGTAGSNAPVTAGSITQLIIDDTYTVVATLPNMRSDYTPAGGDVFQFTWPSTLDSHLKSGSSTTCNYVSSSGGLSTYSFSVTKVSTVWSGNCSFTFKDGVTLNASDQMQMKFVNSRFDATPYVYLDLPGSIGPQTFPLTYDVKMTQGANQVTVISSGSIADLYVGEEYTVFASLTNVRSDWSPLNSEYIQMTWPSGLDSVLDSVAGRTTCSLANSSTPGVYKLDLVKDTATNKWNAQCKFRFGSALSLSSVAAASRNIALSLISIRLGANPSNPTITLPSAGVTKETISITPAWTGGLNVDATDGKFYARSNPNLTVALSDSHWQEDVNAGLTASSISVRVNNANLTCTYSSSGKLFTCPLNDEALYTNQSVSITYPSSTYSSAYFAAATNTAKAATISPIPVVLDNDHIVWVDGSGSENSFPEAMQCLYCNAGSAGKPWYYARYNEAYSLRVPLSIDSTKISNTALLSSGATIDQGSVTFSASGNQLAMFNQTQWSPWSLSATSTSISSNKANLSFTFYVPPTMIGGFLSFGLKGGTADRWGVTYNAGSVFAISDNQPAAVTANAKNIHVREQIAFTYTKYDNPGFDYSPPDTDVCFNVYIELPGTGTTCENNDYCWLDDTPPDPPYGTASTWVNYTAADTSWVTFWRKVMLYLGQPLVNFYDPDAPPVAGTHPDSMAINCHTTNEFKVDVDGTTYEFLDYKTDDTDDAKIKVNATGFDPTSSSVSFQTYLLNSLYIGKATKNWP
jgi:hypothetical protein